MTLFDNKCVTIVEGCIAYDYTADVYCLFCNVSVFYSLFPDNQGQCFCKTGYKVIDGSCIEICGDGLLMNTSSSACDDGNTMNGDGCSSTCSVEVKYKCENGSDSSSSVCFYCGMINLTLSNTKRVEG